MTYFRGSELQNYFTKILEDDLRAIVKPQYVDQIPKTVKVIEFKASRLPQVLGSGGYRAGCNCPHLPPGVSRGHP